MLMPALARAREAGRRVNCLSNMRQITVAWLTYAQSNKGKICGANTGNPADPRFHDWVAEGDTIDSIRRGMLWPYLNSVEVFKCPNDRINYLRTYAMNSWLDGEGPPASGDTMPATNLAQLK